MNTKELLKELNIDDNIMVQSALDESEYEEAYEEIEVPEEETVTSFMRISPTEEEKETVVPNQEKKVQRDPAEKKARVKRLKRMIVTFFAMLVLVPFVLSFIMLGKVSKLNKRIEDIDQVLNIITEELSRVSSQYVTISEAVSEEIEDVHTSPVETPETTEPITISKDEETTASQVEEQEETSIPDLKDKKVIYLTFDDGPSMNTDHILDILDSYGIKATFFMNGFEGYDAQYARIAAEGHSVGMHSFDHVFRSVYYDLDSFVADYEHIHSYLLEKTGVDSHLYRFPGGSSNRVSRMDMKDAIQYLHENGIIYFDWNISSYDASGQALTADEIATKVISQIEASDYQTNVILMHDATNKTSTVEALPIIIERLLHRDDVVFLPITDDTPAVVHVGYEY